MTKSTTRTIPAAPVEKAVEKSKSATKKIKTIADELAVVHGVLQKKLEDAGDDLDNAVKRTGQAEKSLDDAAAKLEEVNKELEDELRQNAKSEKHANPAKPAKPAKPD